MVTFIYYKAKRQQTNAASSWPVKSHFFIYFFYKGTLDRQLPRPSSRLLWLLLPDISLGPAPGERRRRALLCLLMHRRRLHEVEFIEIQCEF